MRERQFDAAAEIIKRQATNAEREIEMALTDRINLLAPDLEADIPSILEIVTATGSIKIGIKALASSCMESARRFIKRGEINREIGRLNQKRIVTGRRIRENEMMAVEQLGFLGGIDPSLKILSYKN